MKIYQFHEWKNSFIGKKNLASLKKKKKIENSLTEIKLNFFLS